MTARDGGNPGPPWKDAADQLEALAAQHIRRELHHAEGAPGTRFTAGGRTLLNFSSNNYLDLAAHPAVVRAAQDAAARWGAGAGGSRLITGSSLPHRELERALARLKGCGDALVFSSGYLAAIGLMQALSHRADGTRVPVIFDRLSHACVVDAARGCGAPWRTFAHNDMVALERQLSRLPAATEPRAIVATEGVFSMDGDLAPIAEMLELCERHGALLIVDDAHGTGTIGQGGAGATALACVKPSARLVQMGTLSKALGSQGGFVAGPPVLRDLLVSRARAFIFDTALAPPCASAALAAIEIMHREPERVVRLQKNARLLRELLRGRGLPVPDSPSPIVPVVIGGAAETMRVSAALRDEGFLVVGIRPPTVPRGTSRLRITPMATHTDEDIRALADAVARHAASPAPAP